ncbi:MAG: MFS transporter, partial [candidate division WOR-3 bacterium]
ISLILALYNGMLFFSSVVFGRLGDMYGRKKIIMWGFLVSTFVLLSHKFIHNIKTIFLMRGLAGLSIGMIPGSVVALAWGNSLGLFSGFGSLGYTLGNFLPGILKNNLLIFSASAMFCVIGFVLSFFIREEKKQIYVPLFPYTLIRKNSGIYLPFFLRHSAAQAIWAIFPIYLTELGANKFQIGLMYALNPFAQFVFMILMDKQKSEVLILSGIACSALTFLGYAISPNWRVILFLQILLGFSWATLYLGSIKYLLKNNLEQATATGFLNSVIGLSGIAGPLIGGLISLLGFRALLFSSAVLSGFAFMIKRKLAHAS